MNEGGSRVAPTTGAFGNPTRSSTTANPRLDSSRSNGMKGARSATPASQNEINRLSEQRGSLPRTSNSQQIRERVQADQQGYALPGTRTTPRSALPTNGGASARPLEYMDRPASRPSAPTTSPTRNVNGIRPASGNSNTIRGVPVAPRATPRSQNSTPTYSRQPAQTDRPPASQSPRTFVPRPNPTTVPNIEQSGPPASSAPIRSTPVRGVAPVPSREYEEPTPRSSSTNRSSSNSEKSSVRRVGSERDR